MVRYLLGVIILGLSACSAPTPKGEAIFQQYCVTCHGPGGQGDGPLAGDLPVPPADLTALSLANDGVFPAEAVMAQVHGYPGRFHQGVMPEFGPVLQSPVVMWTSPAGEKLPTPSALLELTEYLASIQQS